MPGFDLTFKAPKSASVLYAVSDDPRVQAAVIEAGQSAVHAAIGWLEREAIRVQRGSHNQAYLATLPEAERVAAGPRREMTSGVIAAMFRHRTSRAGDPLLHWHTLVANLVEGADGRWSSFAHPELFRHARAAGEVFQAAFRAELTESLGVEWKPGRHVPEIAGIPQHILDLFSKRSTEIEAWLEATGTPNTTEGRQQAVLATRRHKPEMEIGSTRLDTDWKLEADSSRMGPRARRRSDRRVRRSPPGRLRGRMEARDRRARRARQRRGVGTTRRARGVDRRPAAPRPHQRPLHVHRSSTSPAPSPLAWDPAPQSRRSNDSPIA